MRKILLGITALFMGVTLVGCSEVDLTISDTGPLRIGMECDYAPFNWEQTSSNEYTLPISGRATFADGYDVQIAKYLSDELDRDVEIVALEWGALITQLRLGMIDLIIAGMSDTEIRRESIEFTNGYYEATHVVLLKADSIFASGTTLEDFADAKAVGQEATVYDDLIDQLVGASHNTALADVSTIVAGIKAGTIDLTVVEEPVAQGYVAADSSLTYIKLTDGFVVDASDKEVCIGINYGNDKYLDLINEALAKLTTEQRNEMMSGAINRQSSITE